MINLDKAALNSPYLGIEKDIKEALLMHRPTVFGEGLEADSLISEAVDNIASQLRFEPNQISFFNSASAAIAFVARHIENSDNLYCYQLEHRCSREVAESISFDALQYLEPNDYFIISLRNNELGWGIPAEVREVLMNRKFKLILDISGADISDPLIDSADIVFASAGKWNALAGCGLLASRVVLSDKSDRFSGYGLGTVNTINVLTLSGALNWRKTAGVRAALMKQYGDFFVSLAKELGWKINGQGDGIFAFDCGVHGMAFCSEAAALGLTISTGAACSSGMPENQIIKIVYGQQAAFQNVRISWDLLTKKSDITAAIDILRKVHDKFV